MQPLFFPPFFFFYFTINCYKAGSGSEECSSVLSSEAELCNITTESKKSVSDHFSFLFFFFSQVRGENSFLGLLFFFFSFLCVSSLATRTLMGSNWTFDCLALPALRKGVFSEKTNKQTNKLKQNNKAFVFCFFFSLFFFFPLWGYL